MCRIGQLPNKHADVVELVDTPVLGAGAVRRGGSSPLIRTNIDIRYEKPPFVENGGFCFMFTSQN